MIIELLLHHGGDVSLLTHKGERPVDLACDNEVLKLITPDGTCTPMCIRLKFCIYMPPWVNLSQHFE